MDNDSQNSQSFTKHSLSMSSRLFRIHSYLVGERIAQGRFSSVRICFQNGVKKTLCAKIVQRKYADHAKTARLLFNEKNIAPLMMHPCLLKVWDVFQTRQSVIQVSKYYQENLREWLAHGKGFEEKLTVIDDVFSAVEYLHANHICHRDIKCDNVLLTAGERAKLCDLGLASVTFDGKVDGVCGSLDYLAPEVVKRRPFNGFQADVWSCGVLMYVVFSDMYPFPDGDVDDIDFDAEIDFSVVPEPVRSLVQRMMSRDPTARPTMREAREAACFAVLRAKRPLEPIPVLDVEAAVDDMDIFLCSKVAQVIHSDYDTCENCITRPGASMEKLIYRLMVLKYRQEQDARDAVPLRQSGSCPSCVGSVGFKVQNFTARSCDVLDEIDKFMAMKNGCVSGPAINSRTIVVNGQKEDELIPFDCFDIKGCGCDLMINESPTADELVGFLVGKFGCEHSCNYL